MGVVLNQNALLLFAQHFAVGIGLAVLFVLAYSSVTPHKEFRLIREGNIAAAVGLVGATVGFALPLNLVLAVTADPVQAAIWGFIALVIQTLAHFCARFVFPKLSEHITEGQLAAGVVQAGVGIVVGMISAAALTP